MRSYSVQYRPHLRLTAEQMAEEGRRVIAGWRPDVSDLRRDGSVVAFAASQLSPGLRASIEATGGVIREGTPMRRAIPRPFKVPRGASAKRPKAARYLVTTEHYPESAGPPDGVHVIELFWPATREIEARGYAAQRRAQGLEVGVSLHVGREESAMGRALRRASRRGSL